MKQYRDDCQQNFGKREKNFQAALFHSKIQAVYMGFWIIT